MKILILSDGRMGHLNQSIALAKLLDANYDIEKVLAKYNWSKAFTYFLDKLNVKTTCLFHEIKMSDNAYDMIVGTGSMTYYMVKVIAEKIKIKSITMMLPKGYRYDFDIMFAQNHDNPPKQNNIIKIPANFSYVEPKGMYKATKKSIGIIIGGDNKIFKMSIVELKKQLDFIKENYEGYEIAITTSPRSSPEIEKLIASYHFDYEVIFSKNAINPISDFLEECESVFITAESTSMISEVISYGKTNVIVLPLENTEDNKFARFINSLEKEGYLHIFDGTVQEKNKKINFSNYVDKVVV